MKGRLDAPSRWPAQVGGPLAVSRIRMIVETVYHNIHAALWATLCVSVLYGIVFILPALPAMHARMEQQRLAEIAAESRHYCEKWGMPAGTHRNVLCTLDLQTIRANVERRMALDDF